jgi:hypothetical protein
MEKNKPGSKNLPDFAELSDRLIAEPTDAPALVIKTNLDPKNVTEENPYFEGNEDNDEPLRDYFQQS